MGAFLGSQVQAIREHVGERSVFLLASGGVDSTVAAKIIGMALPPERLALLHIDNGLMRKGESAEVVEMFNSLGLGHNLHFIDASDDFLGALEGEVKPEAKRHRIGETFIKIFEREALRLGIQEHLLGQGTIYPDTVETGGTKRAHTIKTHHNRVPIINQMIAEGRVVEPLVDLYKVEVRELGATLGIPDEALNRHPFPGPGLGVRLLCSDGLSTAPDVQADLDQIANAFGMNAMALPIKSVGVKADLRVYEHPVFLTGVVEFKEALACTRRILSEVSDVNRVVWNLDKTTPTSARALAATITRERLDLLREADKIVMNGLREHGLYHSIWQCPTAMVPLELEGRGQEFVVIRPIQSERAMSAQPVNLPSELKKELFERIMALDGVSGVGLDMTSKPPGTIEWE